jgi:hypothetical protein
MCQKLYGSCRTYRRKEHRPENAVTFFRAEIRRSSMWMVYIRLEGG